MQPLGKEGERIGAGVAVECRQRVGRKELSGLSSGR